MTMQIPGYSIGMPRRNVKRDLRPLTAGVKTVKGGACVCDANGYYRPASGAIGEIMIGRFNEAVDNTAGGNGALSADVFFAHERELTLFANDSTVTITSRERLCGAVDDHTVTARNPTVGNAGIVYDVTSEGVWVEIRSGQDPNSLGIVGAQTGSAVLVAGTVLVSAKLSAASQIFLQRQTAGGTVTSTVGYEVASQTPGNPGSFRINAVTSADAVATGDTSTIRYVIEG